MTKACFIINHFFLWCFRIILLTTKGIVVKVGEVGEEDGDGQRRPFSIWLMPSQILNLDL